MVGRLFWAALHACKIHMWTVPSSPYQITLKLQVRETFSCTIVRESAAEIVFSSQGHESWSGIFFGVAVHELLGIISMYVCHHVNNPSLSTWWQKRHAYNLQQPMLVFDTG